MPFQPKVLQPSPDPLFVRQLKQIDPDLRVQWGYERYLTELWTIERRVPPERYYRMYHSLLQDDLPRFIETPIFDEDKPIYDSAGDLVSYAQVGTRTFDLAPEWEWVMFVEEKNGSFRPLDQRTILEIKRVYAWTRFHSLTRARIEGEQAREAAAAKRQERRVDEALQEFKDHRRQIFKLPFVGQVGGFKTTTGSTNKTTVITGDSE